MLKVEDIERIRRANYVEKKSIRAIARAQNHHRRVVREAIAGTSPCRAVIGGSSRDRARWSGPAT